MNAAFGIDHPLLATRDINGLRNRLIALGFNMTPIGKHPWGTSTSLAMFDGCLLEIMGIYDDSLIDKNPAGEFRFGRHVHAHLQQREGVALTALHSTDAQADAMRAAEAGFDVAGHLEFGRDVTLPDGTADRTKTTLALLPDQRFPRMSFFLCQQHRPELIYVPEWLSHPNKVTGISAVNIVASPSIQPELKARFAGLYDGFQALEGGFACKTANGVIRVFSPTAFSRFVGALPGCANEDASPFIAGMDLRMSDPEVLLGYLAQSGAPYQEVAGGYVLMSPEDTANTVLRFVAD